jgi:hypothetical protein
MWVGEKRARLPEHALEWTEFGGVGEGECDGDEEEGSEKGSVGGQVIGPRRGCWRPDPAEGGTQGRKEWLGVTTRRSERDAWVEGHWQVEVRREREKSKKRRASEGGRREERRWEKGSH